MIILFILLSNNFIHFFHDKVLFFILIKINKIAVGLERHLHWFHFVGMLCDSFDCLDRIIGIPFQSLPARLGELRKSLVVFLEWSKRSSC